MLVGAGGWALAGPIVSSGDCQIYRLVGAPAPESLVLELYIREVDLSIFTIGLDLQSPKRPFSLVSRTAETIDIQATKGMDPLM